jgi:site-specific DNA-methyltransferase (adenine-specific)
MKRKLSKLQIHKQHQDIYGDTDTDAVANLADHMSRVGQITPIVVTKSGTIIAGARRVEAAKTLGWVTIDAVVKENIPAELELFYVIQSNKQRTKTSVQLCNEIDALWDHYVAIGPGPGRPKKAALTTRNKGMETRSLVAADLGISTKTIQQLRFIKAKRPDVLPYIGTSLTLEAAYAQVRLWFNQKELLALSETGGQVLNAAEFQLYTKSSADMCELPDESIDHIVTSPPYMAMRQFLPVNGTEPELGQEETVKEYIDNLLIVIEECRRVLSPAGSFLLNIGDSYHKASKMQIPERVSIAIQDRLGLKLRNTMIFWKSTSAAPESTNRRRQSDFEYVYWFVKDAAQYYFDDLAIRVPYVSPETTDKRPPRHILGKPDKLAIGHRALEPKGVNPRWVNRNTGGNLTEPTIVSNVGTSLRHAAGKMPGSVLDISRHVPPPTETSSPVRHTAVMPPRLVRELLKPLAQPGDVVLDPFSGSGTTGAVALEMGCFYVGYDVNPVFNSIGAKRLKEQIKDSQPQS